MMMTSEQASIAFKMNSSKNTMDDVEKMAKHLADLHNRRKTEKSHAEKLVNSMWKERFSTLISKADFMELYYSFK